MNHRSYVYNTTLPLNVNSKSEKFCFSKGFRKPAAPVAYKNKLTAYVPLRSVSERK